MGLFDFLRKKESIKQQVENTKEEKNTEIEDNNEKV